MRILPRGEAAAEPGALQRAVLGRAEPLRSTFAGRAPQRAAWLRERAQHLLGSARYLAAVGGPYGLARWVELRLGPGFEAATWIEQVFAHFARLELAAEPDGQLLLLDEEGDRQLLVTRQEQRWTAAESRGALRIHRQGVESLDTRARAEREATAARFADQLQTISLHFSADAQEGSLPLSRPQELLHEMYGHDEELCTARIETYRSPHVVDAWLDAQLGSLGEGRACFVCPEGGSDRWWRIEPAAPGWLARLLLPELPAYLLLLSADGERALSFTHKAGVEAIVATSLPVREVLAIRDARLRLDDLLATVYPFLRVGHPPLSVRVRLSAIFEGEPDLHLPLHSTPARRDTWLSSCLERFRATFAIDDGPYPAGDRGPYFLSLGAGDHAPFLCVHTPPSSDWLCALWERGDLRRLLVMDGDETAVLALRVTEDRYEAFLRKTRPR